MRTAAMLKINFVLKIARKDRRFFNDLARDPVRTLLESGIDLSPGEMFAVLDVIRGTEASPHARVISDSRKDWQALEEEYKL